MFDCLRFAAILLAAGIPPADAEGGDLDIIRQWLETHHEARSIQLEFTEKRTLPTLKSPIRSEGKLWIDSANQRFRWQSGDPPKTIVLSEGDQLEIVQPRLKRVEIRTAGGKDSNAPPGLAAMTGNFPKTLEEFQRDYRILSIKARDGLYEIHTKPLTGGAARSIREFTFLIDSEKNYLRGFEISLRDRTRVRSDFHRIVRNPPIPESIFEVDTSGFKVIDRTGS